MVRIIIKGGVWRNTEDEILKAAVMKYGKNQWSRVASILHRKSAKQCKCRWFEWLDPSIKKTEWSREEDEKLLHLAKLMPTQWRTIAPIVGRTPAQCLERYEHLLDQAQKKVDGDNTAEDPRKLKVGEIDPNPETKPARPDPIDMDEDEIEMLSEARARLANTQGKKAKRKAREKQLDEARRMSSLQKRRELRAAGLGGGARKVKYDRRRLDYNKEVPFEKKVPMGFHNPQVDEEVEVDEGFQKKLRSELDGERRDHIEKGRRITDKAKLKKRREEMGPDSIFTKSGPEKKRSKLVLPSPQIGDREIEAIVKVGKATDSAREAVSLGGEEGSATLLSEYSLTGGATPGGGGGGTGALGQTPLAARTPLTSTDFIAQEAANIIALTNTESSLKGGVNTPLHESDFSSVLPQGQHLATPNAILNTPSQRAGADGRTPGSTPTGGFTPQLHTPGGMSSAGATPLRDNLNINMDSDFTGERRELVRRGLQSLPRAKNDFELVAPEEDDGGDEMSTVDSAWTEDADDIKAKVLENEKVSAEQDWTRQSQAVQRHLPRPVKPNATSLRPEKSITNVMQEAEQMIKREMLTMMHNDALANPTLAQQGKPLPTAASTSRVLSVVLSGHHVANQIDHINYLQEHPLKHVDDQDLEEAKEVLDAETEEVRAALDARHKLTPATHTAVWQECFDQLLYMPAINRFTRLSLVSKKERIDSAEKEMKVNLDSHMERLVKKFARQEKKLKVLLGGYQSRSAALLKQTAELDDGIDRHQLTLVGTQGQKTRETAAIQYRLATLREEMDQQREREALLQKHYDFLQQRVRELRTEDKATISKGPTVVQVTI